MEHYHHGSMQDYYTLCTFLPPVTSLCTEENFIKEIDYSWTGLGWMNWKPTVRVSEGCSRSREKANIGTKNWLLLKSRVGVAYVSGKIVAAKL